MPRKIHLFSAFLVASGVFAQPSEMAANAIPGPDITVDPATPTVSYSVRWMKGEKAQFSKPNWNSTAEEVWISGQLLVKDDKMHDVELVITVENGECRSARLKKNGRFDVLVPAGAKARLTFFKPEHIAKEVLVDATDLKSNLIVRGQKRNVDFDVILVPEEYYPGQIHPGPVGSITFHRGTGTLNVQYHEKLVAGERICTRTK